MSASFEQNTGAAFELRADGFTFPVVQLLNADMAAFETQLHQVLEKAPAMFRFSPVVIDLSQVSSNDESLDFAMLVGLLRGADMVPIGVRGGSKAQNESANLMELAVLGSGRKAASRPAEALAEPEPTPKTERVQALIVDAPVRSGQRVYARDTDLILLAPVSSGAEVLADGNVHAYRAVRGRVMAGVQGDRTARVIGLDLSPELISIAGSYKVNEDLNPKYFGRPVQVRLGEDDLLFDKI